jgi:hypothetical protein
MQIRFEIKYLPFPRVVTQDNKAKYFQKKKSAELAPFSCQFEVDNKIFIFAQSNLYSAII